MSAFRNVAQRLKDVWGHGGDEDYEDFVDEEEEEDYMPSNSSRDDSAHDDRYADSSSPRPQRFTASPTPSSQAASPSASFTRSTHSSGSAAAGSSSASRRFRSTAMPIRGQEKNIHTLRPRGMDEVSLAADYLKTGCAVVVNLEAVPRTTAIRIIDFMSGVCYGLENQGHAMKLGETIFLFTPGDYEISSDETDYGENRDIIFKDVSHEAPKSPQAPAPAPAPAQASAPQPTIQPSVERRSWER